MPTYEYECLDCGHHFEVFQMMNDEPIKTCPKCYRSVRRLIGTGSGIIFKGPGFYATDYRKTKPLQTSGENHSQKAPGDNKAGNKQPDEGKAAESGNIKS